MSMLLPEGPRTEQVIYLVCRPVHFLLMAITLPVAYGAIRSAEISPAMPGWLLWLPWMGAAVWALLHFGLHSFSFPTSAREALITTASPLLNLYTAGAASFADGALSVVTASMLAACLAFLAVLVILLVPSLRLSLIPAAPAYAPKLLAGLLPGMLVVLWAFGGMFPARSIWLNGGRGLVAGLSFLAQVLSELRILHAGSLFAGPMDRSSERWRLHEAWAPLLIVCMMGSLLAFGIVVLWST